jgi:hypothetical protein
VGNASLMQPGGPLPTVRFVDLPLRFGSNIAAAIIAAKIARGHGTSTSGTHGATRAAHRELFHTRDPRPNESIVVIVRRNVNGRLLANVT